MKPRSQWVAWVALPNGNILTREYYEKLKENLKDLDIPRLKKIIALPPFLRVLAYETYMTDEYPDDKDDDETHLSPNFWEDLSLMLSVADLDL
jgi:hypothetical protein